MSIQEEKQALLPSTVADVPPPTSFYDAVMDFIKTPARWMVGFLCVLVVIIGTLNRLTFKMQLWPMANYLFFVNQMTTIIYLPIFWPIVWGMMLFTKRITPEMSAFPKYKFLVMGALDATSGILMVFGGAMTTGNIQQLLMQGNIPLTMFFSWFLSIPLLQGIFRNVLKVHYRWMHYLGAIIIMGGILVALVPALLQGGGKGNSTFGMILFFCSNIPTAFSGVYKEIAFKGDEDLDVYYVNAWVATFQFVIGLCFFPITALPQFGGLPFKEMPRNFLNGAECLAGINHITCQTLNATGYKWNKVCPSLVTCLLQQNHSTAHHVPSNITCPFDRCDDVGGAWVVAGGYAGANIIYNVVLLFLIKYGSAALFYVCSAAILPAANIAFTLDWLMDKFGPVPHLHWSDIVALLVILFGLGVYRSSSESAPAADDTTAGGEEEEEGEKTLFVGLVTAGGMEPTVRRRKIHGPRSHREVRTALYSRLGLPAQAPGQRRDEP